MLVITKGYMFLVPGDCWRCWRLEMEGTSAQISVQWSRTNRSPTISAGNHGFRQLVILLVSTKKTRESKQFSLQA